MRNALERELQIDQTILNASTSSRLESYSQIDDNELATGFIIDFFKSLHLYSSLEIVEKELYVKFGFCFLYRDYRIMTGKRSDCFSMWMFI